MTYKISNLKQTLTTIALSLGILTSPAYLGSQGSAFAEQPGSHASADKMLRIPALRNGIQLGTTITREDIVWIDMPARQVTNNIVTDPQNLIGMAAAWSLPGERPIRESDVRKPIIAKKGALVTMTVSLPNMKLTAVGRALENGALGDTIRLINTSSSKTVEGVVLADGNVAIGKGIRTASLSN
jgi:flagella basal body P-ring formation protein FlgA